ncbi:uncharacterized protein [Eucyclogobius newberryi]|uniref:uncharacterized protein n=1 Tax=Eucyclogobius newberryi TaxID=166745 RepID=UPI003B597256
MFSHDPLTDFTRKLLDDFIQQENERVELRKKAEEEALERADNMSEVVEENKTVLDIIIPTARPSFYQSSAVEKEAVISDEEQPAEEDNTPQTHNNVEPDVSLSSAVEQPGSVCYSVEAMLGPKLFKPCLYTATKSQEAPASESKTPDNPLDVIDCPYSIASVLKSSIRSSDLHSPSIAPAVVASSESNYKETTLILDNKYAFFPSIQEKPPSFYDSAASQYHNNQYEKTTFWGKFKAKGELTVGLSTLEDEKITTKKREYMPLIKSHCPSQVQKDKFDECDLKLSQFKDKPFLKSDTFLSKPLPTNQGTSVQQNPKGNDRKTSLKNFDYNKQERIASPCVKTLRLNRLFGSLSTAADWTSTVINSVCGNQAVQSAQKYESDGAGQKFHSSEEKKQSLFSGNTSENSKNGCSSKNKREEIERDEISPPKKCHRLFASLTPDFSGKPAVQSARKPICHSEKIKCGSKQATKPSPIPRNTSESTGNISKNNPSKLLVCTSASDSVNCSKREEDNGSAKTPAKPFQSLFTSLDLDSDQALNTNSSFSEKTAVPRVQKVDKSICDGRASTVCNGQNFASAFGSSDLKSENQEEDVESVETPIKSFQSLFASLTRTFGKNIKPDALSYEKAKCDGQNSTSDSNRAKSTTRQSHFPENVSQSPNNANGGRGDVAVAAESTDRLSNSGQNSAASNLKSKNRKDDTDGSARAIQSLFTCLTPEVDRTLTVQPQKVEKSICGNQKFKCDSSQRQSQYNESATGIKCPKPFSSSAMRSNSKEENRDIGSANTPAKSFHHLFSAPLDESAATNDSKMPFLPQSVEGQLSNTKRTSSHASNTENKRTGQSRSATVNSPNVSHETPANPQHQSNNGSPNSIFKSLFQQLNP